MFRLTLSSPGGATGSVIQDPNRDPDVFMVIGSEIPVNFPHAEAQRSNYEDIHAAADRSLTLLVSIGNAPNLCMQARNRSSRLITRMWRSW